MTTLTASASTPSLPLAPYKSLDNVSLRDRIQAVRDSMGKRLLILGHHYQQDEVIELSDLRGDSYQLSQMAAASTDCRAIAFCGVHFMAETADILANRPERVASRHGERVTVVLPDMAAGCSMADMAMIDQVENCWDELGEVIDTSDVTPVTYINSAASLKAFCGKNGGIVCTSSNAAAVLKWAFERRKRVLFFPDQHLGRNTALAMGIPIEQMPVWNPHAEELGEAHSINSRIVACCCGKATAASMQCSVLNTSISSVRSIPASRCSCILNARAKSSRKPTFTARRVRSFAKSNKLPPARSGRSALNYTS